MTTEVFMALVREAELQRERTSDHLLTFEDVESRLDIDRAAEQLLLSCVMCRFKWTKHERPN
jgi:hypothetical protein